MTTEEFIARLAAAAPRHETLLGAGISREVADELIRAHTVTRRGPPDANNSIIVTPSDLFNSCDVSNVEIGIVRFLEHLKPHGRFVQFARAEADPLVISPNSSEVLMLDHAARERVMGTCAITFDGFLAAMIRCSSFLSQCAWDLELCDDDEKRMRALRDSVQLAGGDGTAWFYRMLLGAYSEASE